MNRSLLSCFAIITLIITGSFAFAADTKVVLVAEKFTSKNTYLIIARGYPRPGITDNKSADNSAKEAAILNAQLLGKERFIDSFDVIRNGRVDKVLVRNGSVDVWYTFSWPDIKHYMRKK
jgi:hypothetical protein